MRTDRSLQGGLPVAFFVSPLRWLRLARNLLYYPNHTAPIPMADGIVRIVSWLGGEHWYIDQIQFLRLEEAIASCERQGLQYEIVEDPRHYYKRNGD